MKDEINDGYTLPGEVKDQAGKLLFTFQFRPMTGAKRQRMAMAAIHLAPQGYAGTVVAAEMFEQAATAHLVSWSRIDSAGRPVPVTREAVGALDGTQFDQLYNQISMWSELKIGPAPKPDEKDERPTNEESSAKNSPEGSVSP